ncbi:helix-turn-helix transcriptional regulator [Micromonospora endolithica]|uniref:Helix-turn-helix transcriptional regulator n=1 Tax=Micromonospora endolithica TaxID=230091 RepID=A0A3A9YZD2_9ACTN|nr:helix-turn-helix transcriptional regulator [Micromonospora endolithica]RKN40577.1 helix-turn-helix transcriptional regulator [Micromonospora endolithica]TWJ21658.1 putative ATPase [Micromonospora endolithica]
MASDVDTAPLVGRADLVAAVRSALLDEVAQGSTAAVFLTGESGVGKTRLLREIGARLRDGGALVLTGTCLDIGDASPLHPLLQALRRFDGELTTSHARTSSAVRGLLQMFADETAGPDGAGALLERVSRGLHLIAEGRPLVLVLDDLQWVDRSTRQLLLYLLAGLGDLQLSVLAAVRAESLQGAHPLRRVLTELRRLRTVRVLDLAPLDRAGTEQLAAAVVGRPLSPEAAEQVWRRSGGNPFVVEELARDVRDGRDGLSDTLREIFLSRVDALPQHAHTVVHAVAAGVEPVEHWLLANVVRLPEDQLIEAVRAAVAHRLLVGADDGYRLRHRLVAEVLEHELLPAERAALHRRYAEALTAAPADLHQARLAHHWRLAGEPARALPAAVAAAKEAERLHGYAEAHRHWSTALQLAGATTGGPPETSRVTLLERAAEAAHHCGEHARALTLLEELAASDAGRPACGLHIQRARYLAAAGRSALAEAEYQRALDLADCTPAERATAAAHLAELLLHLGRYADAGHRAREALKLSAAVEGSTSEVVLASAALGFSEAYLEDPDAGLAVMRQALETAERAGRPEDVACAYLHLAELLTGPLNILEEGVVVARRGAERVAELGLGRTYETRLLAIATNGLFRVGQWAEAEKVVAAALRHRPSGADAVELLLARCRLSVGYGDIEAADRDLDAVATVLAGGGARHVLPLLTLRSGLAMWQGRHDLARQAVQRGLTESRSDDGAIVAALVWHGLRAEAEAHASRTVEVDQTAVRRLRGVAERVARRSAGAVRPVRSVVDGFLALCAAEVSRLDGSDPELWARSVAEWDRRNHPYPAAYSRLRQAEALLARRSRSATAAALLRQAYQVAQALGAVPLTSEIRTLAGRARVSLEERTGPAAAAAATGGADRDELAVLTAREREVLAAVAEGLTNREIGQRLFISERTIGVHVSHIFDKLQVRTRVQASAIFLRNRSS